MLNNPLRLTMALFAIAMASPAQANNGCEAEEFQVEALLQGKKPIIELGRNAKGELVSIRRDHLDVLHKVHQKLGEAFSRVPRLYVNCSPSANAFARYSTQSITVASGMLEVLQGDRDMTASLLGHEYAHLFKNHSAETRQRTPWFLAKGRQAAVKSLQAGDNREEAQRKGSEAIKRAVAEFSRTNESEADTVGTRKMAEAGFDPRAALKLAKLMADRAKTQAGLVTVDYLQTHPGWLDRIDGLEPTVIDEENYAMAESLEAMAEWQKLVNLVNDWLNQVPNGSKGWYKRGELLARLRQAGSTAAFEQAVTHDRDFTKAWYSLCLALFKEGHTLESAHCSTHLPQGKWQEQYRSRTFGERLYVATNATQGNSLWLAQDTSGGKIITNDKTLLEGKGIGAVEMAPAWRVMRYKPTVATPIRIK